MFHSYQDLARLWSDQLLTSPVPSIRTAGQQIDAALATRQARPDSFDHSTDLALAGIIVRIAEFGYKIWKDLGANSSRIDEQQLQASIRSELQSKKVDLDPLVLDELVSSLSRLLSGDATRKSL